MSFAQGVSLTFIIYWQKQVNIYSCFPYFLHSLGEIRCKKSQHNSVDHLWASWMLRQHLKHCPIYFFSIFPLICMKFGTEGLYKTSFSNCNFHENLCCESHTVHKGVNKFPYVYSTLIFRFGFNSVYDVHIMLLCIWKLKENRRRKAALFFCKNLHVLWQRVSLWKKRMPW